MATLVPPVPVVHRDVEVDGLRLRYREAGPPDAPVVLLPHGYPCSSFEFRGLMAMLGDRWRLLAPDLPGFGCSDTPTLEELPSTFAALGGVLRRFAETLALERYVLYLHDYGSQLALRLAMAAPERVAGLIIQNGDIYEDALGPKYETLRAHWAHPTDAGRATLAANVSEEGFRDEFAGELPAHLAERVAPDLWQLHWRLMDTPLRRARVLALFEDQATTLAAFPAQQAYLREHRPPTLIAWGPHDGYMPEASARAYLRDLPDAELHLLDGGHWALETNLGEVVALARDFLTRVHPA